MPGPSTFVDSITSRISSAIGLSTSMPTRKSSGFNVEEFKSVIGSRGILPTNLFLVTIQSAGLSSRVNDLASAQGLGSTGWDMSFFCMKTDLPGLNLATADNIIHGTGPVEYFPHNMVFTDIDLEFLGDGRGQILSFFHQWMNSIVDFNASGLNTRSPDFYKVKYKETYVCNIEIVVFDHQSNQIMRYKLIDAFPTRLGQISMNWESSSYMNIGVSFKYSTWTSTNLFTPTYDEAAGLSNVQKLLKLGTIAQTISAIRKPTGIADIINVVNNANIVSSGFSGF
jgi:hypothetical protein